MQYASNAPFHPKVENASILFSNKAFKNENNFNENNNYLNNFDKLNRIAHDFLVNQPRHLKEEATASCLACNKTGPFQPYDQFFTEVVCVHCNAKNNVFQALRESVISVEKSFLKKITCEQIKKLAVTKIFHDNVQKELNLLKKELIKEREKVLALQNELSFAKSEISRLNKKMEYSTIPPVEKNFQTKKENTTLSFADAAILNGKPKKFTTKFSKEELINFFEEKPPKKKSLESEFLFFRGCPKTKLSKYRQILELKGIRHYLAQDIIFLSDEIMQVTVLSVNASSVISAFESISKRIKYLKDFDPLRALSYSNFNNMSDSATEEAYFRVLKQAITRLQESCKSNPKLSSPLYFIKNVVDSRNIKFTKGEGNIQILGKFISST